MDDATMSTVLQVSVLLLCSTVYAIAHLLAQVIVANGFGLIAIILLLLSPRFLSRYLD
jgi:hypothetical protein